MAPSGRTTTTRSTSTTSKTKTKPRTATKTIRTRQPRESNFKKQKQHIKSKKQEIATVCPSSCSWKNEVCEVIDANSSSCSTPKGQKFKIPEISTCPPAPKKPRVLSSNCSLHRSPLSFFSPLDLEHFFVALQDVLV